MTLNTIYNEMLKKWNSNDCSCENCGQSMEGKEVYEGKYGWYCSETCSGECDQAYNGPSDEEERRYERQQMGLTG